MATKSETQQQLRNRLQLMQESYARVEAKPAGNFERLGISKMQQLARFQTEMSSLESQIQENSVKPAKMQAARRSATQVQTQQNPPAQTNNAPSKIPSASTSEYARLMAQTRALPQGILAGAREVADPSYQNSDKFAKDLRRLIVETSRGNFSGDATRNAAATAGGARLGGAMAQAANMRALTRLIPVIGQVAGAGMIGAAVGSELYDANDTEIQDALAKLSGIDPATGLRGQADESPGSVLDRLTETADEIISQAKEATAVNKAWNQSQIPMGRKPQR